MEITDPDYNQTFLKIPELDNMVLDHLDMIVDGKKLVLVNKYYYETINNNKIYRPIKTIFKNHNFYARSRYGFISKGSVFYKLCVEGHIVAAKYFYKKYPEKIIRCTLRDTFNSCDTNLELRKWLYSLDKTILVENVEIHRIFSYACSRNDLEMMNLLYSLAEPRINIRYNNDVLFQSTCLSGALEAAKWLYSLDNDINICANNYCAFKYSCLGNHLELAKWLYSLGQFRIDDYPDIEGLFDIAAKPKSLNLFMWLASLTLNCELVIKDGKLVGYHLTIKRYHVFSEN